MKTGSFLKQFCAGFCLLFLFFSCSDSRPDIEYGFIELVFYPSETGDNDSVERFSFFVMARDDDGIGNLIELNLYHEREGLRWKLTNGDWLRLEIDGNTWLGSRNLAMPYDERLPRGQFRAELINRSGEKTERIFTYDGPESPRFPYPALIISSGWYRIDSQYPENRFICYDIHGDMIQMINITRSEGMLEEIWIHNDVVAVALWAVDEERRTSSMSEAVSIREF